MTIALLTLSLVLSQPLLPGTSAVHAAAFQQPARAEAPGPFYERYLAAIQNAQRIEDLYEFWSDDLRAQMDAMKTSGSKVDLQSVRANYTVLGVKVVGTVPWRTRDVRLVLEGTSPSHQTKGTGSVVLINEHGTWKVADSEGWTFAD